MPRYGWSEVDATERCLADAAMAQGHIWDQATGEWVPSAVSAAEQAQKDADNKERSVRRARTKVRRLIKSKDLNTMLTLTYRENMVDRARMQRDFDVFMKRVRRIFPGFQYVCVFERQKRGAWHAHIAVRRLLSHYVVKGVMVKSYDLLRTVWRAVVGEGNVDVSKAVRRRRCSVAKLASYLSKYISKGFDECEGGDSYRASGKRLPPPVVIRCSYTCLHEAVSALYDLLETVLQGDRYSTFLDKGGFYLSSSPP
ncbi:MAG: hypothetical protein JSR64_00685 [Nitrospira sp.]|nr:hypothetical protein [Nitrospira sp.]